MLTMSHTCNASDRGGGGWKESYRSTDSVESTEESADSDHSSSSSSRNAQTGGGSPGAGNNGPNSAPHQPIGCITTHRVSTVIRPERKMPPIDPLQFVKVKKNDLCIKVRMAGKTPRVSLFFKFFLLFLFLGCGANQIGRRG